MMRLRGAFLGAVAMEGEMVLVAKSETVGIGDRRQVRRGLFLALILLLAVPLGYATGTRYHGMILDDKHALQLEEEEGGWITVKLRRLARAAGGPQIYHDPETEEASVIRCGEEEVLAKLRAEVLVPAPPNYVGNPGQRYRITVQGVTVAPDYTHVFEVDAANALDAVFNEFKKIYDTTEGVERDALYYGAIIAMRVLNKSFHLPAEIPLTTLRGGAGQIRIQGQYYERGEQARVKRFAGLREGRDFVRTHRYAPEVIKPRPELIHGPARERGTPAEVQRETPYLSQRYRPSHDLRPKDVRANQVRSLDAQKAKGDTPGTPGKPLTVPEEDYPAITASQMESLEMLLGPMKSAMEARIEGATAGREKE